MLSRVGLRPVLDAAGKTVGYLTAEPHLPPNARADTRVRTERPARTFWGAYYRRPVSAKRRTAA